MKEDEIKTYPDDRSEERIYFDPEIKRKKTGRVPQAGTERKRDVN